MRSRRASALPSWRPSERFGKMPTVSGVLRALPNPADHPIFVIKTWNNRIDGFQMSLNQNLVDTARPFTI